MRYRFQKKKQNNGKPDRELESMATASNYYAHDYNAMKYAQQRWQHRHEHHRNVNQVIAKKASLASVEPPDRLHRRFMRLAGKTILDEDHDWKESRYAKRYSATGDSNGSDREALALEATISETRDLHYVNFLAQALFVAEAVCRITVGRPHGVKCFGTGFLVTPNLLLTNNHVIHTKEEAEQTEIEFGYQRDRTGKINNADVFRLKPSIFFLTCKELDFTLVAIDKARREDSLKIWCPLLKDQGKILNAEFINIIQHPRGEPKQVVIRENHLLDSFEGKENFLQYTADTDQGSSGSPVFNDQWEVIALHRTAIPKTDRQGNWLTHRGDIWKEGDGLEAIEYVANEGIRASKIVLFVEKQSFEGKASELQKEFLSAPSPDMDAFSIGVFRSKGQDQRTSTATRSLTISNSGEATTEVKIDSHTHESTSRNSQNINGEFSISIPLKISLRLGD